MQDLLTKTLVVLSSIAWTATPNFLFFWTSAMHYQRFFNISVLKFLEEFQLPKASSFIQMSLISSIIQNFLQIFTIATNICEN